MGTGRTRGAGTVSYPSRDGIMHVGYGKADAIFLLARERFVSTLKYRSIPEAFWIATGLVAHTGTGERQQKLFDRLRDPAADAQLDPYLYNAHAHFVGMNVRGQRALVGLIAQKIPPHKPLNDFDLVVIGTLARHFPFLAILSQRPERDAGNMAPPKVPQKVSVQVRLQRIKGNPGLAAGCGGKRGLTVHPTGLPMQVTEDHLVISLSMPMI